MNTLGKCIITGWITLCVGAISGIYLNEKIENKQTISHPELSKLDLCKVERIADGDTCTLILPNGDKTIIRLAGVDTPETVDPRKEVQEYGPEASTNLRNLLHGEQVWLEVESAGKPDRFGRTLGYIYRYPDGLCVNLEILRNGYGHFLTQYPCKYKEVFQSAADKAKEAKKGIHSLNGLNKSPVKKSAKKKK